MRVTIAVLGGLLAMACIARVVDAAPPDPKRGAYLQLRAGDVLLRELSDKEEKLERAPARRKLVRHVGDAYFREVLPKQLTVRDARWRGAELQLYRGTQPVCRAQIKRFQISAEIATSTGKRRKDAWNSATHYLVGVLGTQCDAAWARLASLPAVTWSPEQAVPADLQHATEAAVRALPEVQSFRDHHSDDPASPAPIRSVAVAHAGTRTFVWAVSDALGTCDIAVDYWTLWEDRGQDGRHELVLLGADADGYNPTFDGLGDLDGDGAPEVLINRGVRLLHSSRDAGKYELVETAATDEDPDC